MTSKKKTTPAQLARIERLLPGGVPRWVRCYDDGDRPDATWDRFTVVYTGRAATLRAKGFAPEYQFVGMSSHPTHPQGFGQHGTTQHHPADRPTYGHLGRKIKFTDLPADCQ